MSDSPLESEAAHPAASLTLAEAHQRLKQFDCLQPGPTLSEAERSLLQQAVRVVAQHSDYQILGICADSIAAAQQALATYAAALGYQPQLSTAAIAGAVYVKFNPKSGLCYADAYTGNHRGVLVSCQSAYSDRLNDMYGHLPLDLFVSDALSGRPDR